MKDSTGGVVVHTRQALTVNPGDRLDVVGFAVLGDYVPMLQDAVIQKQEAGPPPLPVYVTPEDAMTGNYHTHLVEMEATLLDQGANSTGRVLTLQAGRHIFNAFLEGTPPFAQNLAALRPGSVVQVTGVCLVEAERSRATNFPTVQGFELQLRTADDVVVLKAASWWSIARVMWVLGGSDDRRLDHPRVDRGAPPARARTDRLHPPSAGDRSVAETGRAIRQQREIGLPGEHEPRDSDADERRHRHDDARARDEDDPVPGRLPQHRQELGRVAAHDSQ